MAILQFTPGVQLGTGEYTGFPLSKMGSMSSQLPAVQFSCSMTRRGIRCAIYREIPCYKKNIHFLHEKRFNYSPVASISLIFCMKLGFWVTNKTCFFGLLIFCHFDPYFGPVWAKNCDFFNFGQKSA